jgi:hypothetical protein
VRRTARDVSDRKPETQLAVIRRLNPLQAELTESSIKLDEEDLSLAQSVRRYDADKGLAVGDALVVTPLRNGDWVAHDVVSEKVPPANVDSAVEPLKVTGSRGGNAALNQLLIKLDSLNIIKNETTA